MSTADLWDAERARRIDAGLCVTCGKVEARPDRLLCWSCADRVRVRLEAQRRARGVVVGQRRCGLCGRKGHRRETCWLLRRRKAAR